jgi:hypothetical protein
MWPTDYLGTHGTDPVIGTRETGLMDGDAWPGIRYAY